MANKPKPLNAKYGELQQPVTTNKQQSRNLLVAWFKRTYVVG
jgi:hypothetical protein